ncbi:hypothetical protein HYU22_01895 [Candidatus Woesearchaeota archaeon]|nr:hypothetical protein [Candidatus Woesearchaeota archaeon]
MMKCYALVLPGLEHLCRQEVKELLSVRAVGSAGLVEFAAAKEDFFRYAFRAQAVQRVLIALGKCKDVDSFSCDAALPWADFFPTSFSFKVEVEHIKGQENRFLIARTIAGKMFSVLEPQGFKPVLELKTPDFLILVYFTGKEYAVGIDVASELASRHYRVFTHQASLKGDLAYAIIRASGFVAGEKLVVGFVKDGTLAIEAALFANALPVPKALSLAKFPMYAKASALPVGTGSTVVYGFDESAQNIIAAQKNSLLAGTKNCLQLRSHPLEELDIAVAEQSCDRIIFHLTSKDESKINELYRQVMYVLKPKGALLIFSISALELPIPTTFLLKKKAIFQKGDNKYRVWVLQKK